MQPLALLAGLRTLVLGGVVAGFTTAASAATLDVYTTDTANVLKSTFVVGETFLLKVTGDSQGGSFSAAFADAFWDASLTTTVDIPSGCRGSVTALCTSAVQGNWYADKGVMIRAGNDPTFDGHAYLINQTGVRTAVNVDTSFITLRADAVGATQVTWGGTYLAFFGIYSYDDGAIISVPTGHSFTIVPEPVPAVLIGLGLLGLAGWRRARA
jgi:hypothetical protein